MLTEAKMIHDNIQKGGNIALNAFIAKGAKVEYSVNVMHGVTIYGSVKLGKYTYLNVNTIVYSNVEICRYCSIARNREIGIIYHPVFWLTPHPFQFDKTIFKNENNSKIP